MKRKCKTPNCNNNSYFHRTECNSCIQRRIKEADPVRFCYNQLKRNAERRGKEFTISIEYFRQFCLEVDYIAGKGKSQSSYTIDRIDPGKGYTPGNICVLSNSENASKGVKKLEYEHFRDSEFIVKYYKPQKSEGPF